MALRQLQLMEEMQLSLNALKIARSGGSSLPGIASTASYKDHNTCPAIYCATKVQESHC